MRSIRLRPKVLQTPLQSRVRRPDINRSRSLRQSARTKEELNGYEYFPYFGGVVPVH